MTRTTRVRAGTRLAALSVAAGLTLGGCSYDGIDSVALPFRQGTGSDAYTVVVELAQVSGLTRNSEVKVGDVTVGTIEHAGVGGWTARLTVGLDGDVELPANATATVGQKSLLGAKYLEIAAPPQEPAIGRLQDGDVVPLARTTAYPETEQVLATLGVVLNGSGLQQVRTITDELNAVLGGREQDVKGFIQRLDRFLGALDDQRDDLVRLVENLNRLSTNLQVENGQLARAVDEIPDALAVLNEDRGALVRTLDSVGKLGEVGTRVIDGTRDDLLANLRQTRPALARLADANSDLTQSLSQIVSFPFPANTSFPAMFKGDYANLFMSLDLSPDTIRRNFTEGFQLDTPGAPSLLGAPPLGRGDLPATPLTPFTPEVPAVPTLPALPGAPAPDAPASPPGEGEGEGLLGGLIGGNG